MDSTAPLQSAKHCGVACDLSSGGYERSAVAFNLPVEAGIVCIAVCGECGDNVRSGADLRDDWARFGWRTRAIRFERARLSSRICEAFHILRSILGG